MLRECRAELREMRRPERDRKLRAGQVQPRNRREYALFAADLLHRDQVEQDHQGDDQDGADEFPRAPSHAEPLPGASGRVAGRRAGS